MPHPTRRHTLEVIDLPEGIVAPPGAQWVNLSQVLGGGWCLEGNIPVPLGVMFEWGEYPSRFAAMQAALDHALNQGCPLLYVETNARGCGD